MPQIRRAILSVSRKDGLIPFAKFLKERGLEIISTGGTADLLRKNKISVTEVSDYTGFPEILGGRLKTLHPKIHGGILGIRGNVKHEKEMEGEGLSPIDLVVVNLYPFEEKIAEAGCSLEEAIENIDIGGPTLLRAAAKNYPSVTVVSDPEDYDSVMAEIKGGGSISIETNFKLAQKVFTLMARYDGAISSYLNAVQKDRTLAPFSKVFHYQALKICDLRYGENPHQQAAFYRERHLREASVAAAEQVHGKELSYNNILDLDSGLAIVREFQEMAAVIVKHNNPCGVAISQKSLHEAFIKARDCDPESAFGGVIVVNVKVDKATAEGINEHFYEAVLAPDFEAKALEILRTKKNIRLLKVPDFGTFPEESLDFRKVAGGLLVQTKDLDQNPISATKVVTTRRPTDDELKALDFAWKVVKHVKSNAIVYARADRTLGIGAGQMSRIDSAKLAVLKARSPLKGAVLASDAFFPFRDTVEEAATVGITAIIQPGGSLRDQESIEAANEHGMAMLFTGTRHFRH